MEVSLAPALLAVIGSIAVGLMSIAAAMFFRLFRSPKEDNDMLTHALGKLGEKVEKNANDHHDLSRNVAVLATEVRHLAENVERLGNEFMQARGSTGNRLKQRTTGH